MDPCHPPTSPRTKWDWPSSTGTARRRRRRSWCVVPDAEEAASIAAIRDRTVPSEAQTNWPYTPTQQERMAFEDHVRMREGGKDVAVMHDFIRKQAINQEADYSVRDVDSARESNDALCSFCLCPSWPTDCRYAQTYERNRPSWRQDEERSSGKRTSTHSQPFRIQSTQLLARRTL